MTAAEKMVHVKPGTTVVISTKAKTVSAGTKVVTFREIPLSLEDAYMVISGIDQEEAAGAEAPQAAGAQGGESEK